MEDLRSSGFLHSVVLAFAAGDDQDALSGGLEVRELDGRLVEMYRDVGKVLSTYRSGRLPKAFKIVPK